MSKSESCQDKGKAVQTLRMSLLSFTIVIVCNGCGHDTSAPERRAATDARLTITASGGCPKKLLWIQPLKGHPTHQLTQMGFREGCRKLGYEAVIVGTDTYDLAGTISLAEQAVANGDVAGMAVWAGSPAYNSLIEKAHGMGIPVILPHFPIQEGTTPGATGIISCDPAVFAAECAQQMGDRMAGKGVVALTQGSFNTTENTVTEMFLQAMKARFPQIKVLPPIEEGFDTPAAINKAVSILQTHADVTAALSSTGGGALVWASAARETGRTLLIVSMNYTRANLDLVRDGEVYAVVGQPLWEESAGAAELLDRAIRGEQIPWWTKLPAPIISKEGLADHYRLLDEIEATLRP